MYLDDTTFNDGAITALSNSAIDDLVSLRALSNTLQHLPLLLFLLFLFSSILYVFVLLASGLSLLISLLFLLAKFVYIELSFLPDAGLWCGWKEWTGFFICG